MMFFAPFLDARMVKIVSTFSAYTEVVVSAVLDNGNLINPMLKLLVTDTTFIHIHGEADSIYL
jgi:hypothetical protein